MTRVALLFPTVLVLFAVPGFAPAQDMPVHDDAKTHDMHMAGMMPGGPNAVMPDGVTEPGQSAFAAIQQIVAKLMAEPATDWTRVDIDGLRQHLIDMDNVTLHAQVATQNIDGGVRFEATSDDTAVTASIRAMVSAHAAAMDGVEGWTMAAAGIPGGASLTVTGADVARIRALGFIGIMTVGMHHQAHHLELALGQNPHGQ